MELSWNCDCTCFFLVLSIKYFFEKLRERKIVVTSIFFIGLTIPLFGWDFFNDPTDLIPQSWYNRYDVEESVTITLPWSYESEQAKILSDSAFQLKKAEEFTKAIEIYKQSLHLEYNPRTLYEISEALAKVNKLEEAISSLDNLIQIDSTQAPVFCNRGLLFYKLKENDKAISDYLKAIKLKPNLPTYHSNLALAYYYTNQYQKACEEISLANNLGSNLLTEGFFPSVIKQMDCQIKTNSNGS